MKQAREERETLRRYEQQRRDTGDVRLPYACHSLILFPPQRARHADLVERTTPLCAALPLPFGLLLRSSFRPPNPLPARLPPGARSTPS
jgi:hypothetical protein